jgi:hypothetical protein
MRTFANTQAFQSVYINPNAEKWEDRIVLHDPIFQDEISGVIALKSYRLEDCLGFVLNAPISRIRYFRDTVKKGDKKEGWGKLKPNQILKKLTLLVDEIGGKITYLQNKVKGAPKEKIDGDKPKGKFKPKKVKKGKSIGLLKYLAGYARSERVIPDKEKEVCVASRRIYSPGVGVYPEGIIDAGKVVWDKLLYTIYSDLYTEEDTYKRWQIALYGFDKKCEELNLHPYKVSCGDVLKIKENMLSSLSRAKKEILSVYRIFDNEGIVDRMSKIKMEKVFIDDTDVVLIGNYEFKLKDSISIDMPMQRELDGRTSISFDFTAPKVIASVYYTLPIIEAETLLGTTSPIKLVHGLHRFVK